MPWNHTPQSNTFLTYAFQAHFATLVISSTIKWLLDSSASHHATSNIQNLSLHTDYPIHDNIVIINDTNLPLTYTSSISLPSPSKLIHLNNVFCVPSMNQNLIFVYQLCLNNNISIEFSPTSFFCEVPSHKSNNPIRGN